MQEDRVSAVPATFLDCRLTGGVMSVLAEHAKGLVFAAATPCPLLNSAPPPYALVQFLARAALAPRYGLMTFPGTAHDQASRTCGCLEDHRTDEVQ